MKRTSGELEAQPQNLLDLNCIKQLNRYGETLGTRELIEPQLRLAR